MNVNTLTEKRELQIKKKKLKQREIYNKMKMDFQMKLILAKLCKIKLKMAVCI